jgi:cytoskeleton protein RodZ
MSGVVKDDPIPDAASDKTVSAAGDAEAGHAEAPAAAAAETEGKHGRKGAPHLRVVTGDAAADFVSELPPQELALAPEVLPNQRIGSAIRSRRETLGYSLDQVAKDTRVHLSHLRAIEDMTPNLLGAPVYAKGYIRAYARYLGLDEMSTLERYLRECAILKDPEKQEIAPPTTGRSLPATVPVLGFLIVALIGGAAAAFFMNGGNGGGGKTTTEAATEAQAPVAGSSGTAAVADPIPAQQLRIVALRRSLLDVRSADGTKMAHRVFEAGEGFTVRVGSGWTVSALEDGSAFEWRLGDKSLGLMSDMAAPMNAQSVDIAATRPPIEQPVVTPELTDAEKLNAAPGAASAAGAAPAATAPATPGANGATLAPAKPKPRSKPPAAATTATPETAPPAAAATPPAQPATPAQDPALLAYPNQPAAPTPNQ